MTRCYGKPVGPDVLFSTPLSPHQFREEGLGLLARAPLIRRYAAKRFFNMLAAAGPRRLTAFLTLHSLTHDQNNTAIE